MKTKHFIYWTAINGMMYVLNESNMMNETFADYQSKTIEGVHVIPCVFFSMN